MLCKQAFFSFFVLLGGVHWTLTLDSVLLSVVPDISAPAYKESSLVGDVYGGDSILSIMVDERNVFVGSVTYDYAEIVLLLKHLAKLPVGDLHRIIGGLSQSNMKFFSKHINLVKTAKYSPHKHRKPKYGRLDRSFSDDELKAFFLTCRNRSVKVKFVVMLLFGLRISEVSDLDWVRSQRVLVVNNRKGNRKDQMPVPESWDWILDAFFSSPKHTTNYLSKCFNHVRDDMSDDFGFSYATTSDGRKQYLKSSHSMRHTAGNILHRHTKNEFAVSQYLRHEKTSAFGVTGTYLHYSLDQQRKDMEEAFAEYIIMFKQLLGGRG